MDMVLEYGYPGRVKYAFEQYNAEPLRWPEDVSWPREPIHDRDYYTVQYRYAIPVQYKSEEILRTAKDLTENWGHPASEGKMEKRWMLYSTYPWPEVYKARPLESHRIVPEMYYDSTVDTRLNSVFSCMRRMKPSFFSANMNFGDKNPYALVVLTESKPEIYATRNGDAYIPDYYFYEIDFKQYLKHENLRTIIVITVPELVDWWAEFLERSGIECWNVFNIQTAVTNDLIGKTDHDTHWNKKIYNQVNRCLVQQFTYKTRDPQLLSYGDFIMSTHPPQDEEKVKKYVDGKPRHTQAMIQFYTTVPAPDNSNTPLNSWNELHFSLKYETLFWIYLTPFFQSPDPSFQIKATRSTKPLDDSSGNLRNFIIPADYSVKKSTLSEARAFIKENMVFDRALATFILPLTIMYLFDHPSRFRENFDTDTIETFWRNTLTAYRESCTVVLIPSSSSPQVNTSLGQSGKIIMLHASNYIDHPLLAIESLRKCLLTQTEENYFLKLWASQIFQNDSLNLGVILVFPSVFRDITLKLALEQFVDTETSLTTLIKSKLDFANIYYTTATYSSKVFGDHDWHVSGAGTLDIKNFLNEAYTLIGDTLPTPNLGKSDLMISTDKNFDGSTSTQVHTYAAIHQLIRRYKFLKPVDKVLLLAVTEEKSGKMYIPSAQSQAILSPPVLASIITSPELVDAYKKEINHVGEDIIVLSEYHSLPKRIMMEFAWFLDV